jgi:excisionase family DNA binding protein
MIQVIPAKEKMTDFDPVEWITTNEAAELTGYDTSRFRQLAKRGVIQAIKRGRDWFFSKTEVVAYHEEMQRLGAEKNTTPGGKTWKNRAEGDGKKGQTGRSDPPRFSWARAGD